MTEKPRYEDLEKRVKELEEESVKRKRAEEALRESTEKFLSIIDSSSDWVWEVDTKGAYTYASHRVRDILGYKPEEVLNRYFVDFIMAQDKNRSLEIFKSGVASRKPFYRFELIHLHKDGREVGIEVSSTPIIDDSGKLVGFRGTNRDITDRKTAEKALRENEARFRSFIDSATEGFFLWNSDVKLIEVNKAGIKLISKKIKKSDLQGKSILEILPEIKEEGIYDHCLNIIRSGDTLPSYKLIPYSRFGDRYFNIKLFKVDGGLGMIGEDVTERKRAEESQEGLINDLQYALDSIKTLKGLLPICSNCKKIRDDMGYWSQMEKYIEHHSDASFSHGLCPECAELLYSHEDWYKKKNK